MYDHKQSMKELIKHALLRFGLIDVLDTWRQGRGIETKHVGRADMTAVFSDVYSNGAWVVADKQDSLSGAGSTSAATSHLLGGLSNFLADVGCHQLVDIGCGDFNWMRHVEGDFNYLGLDVVPAVIALNNSEYGDTRRRFTCMDATSSPIPPGDVAICREVLFHLSLRDGMRLLRNIKAAGFRYVLLTTEGSVWFNSDIRNGQHRRINLSKAPFRLPKPYAELPDHKVAEDRVLAAWPGSALPG